MHLKRIIGAGTAAIAIAAAAVLYTVHPVKSSDHQDTYNLAKEVGHNKSADITDVFVFPSPANPNNVVFIINVSPLIPAGMGTANFFDPTLMYQIKIAHGAATNPEDQVIQFGVTGTGAGQTLSLYGPAKPKEVGTVNTFVTPTGATFGYNETGGRTLTVQGQPVQVFAGPRADPFRFDLFAFFSFLGDRSFETHTSQSDPGAGNSIPNVNANTVPGTTANAVSPPYDQTANRVGMPTFNGFAGGTTAGAGSPLGNYACSTGASQNALADIAGGFNVLSLVVEMPKSLLTTGYASQTIHTWATVSSSTTTN